MPEFRVTAPDGRTFKVTAPEGATQEQVLARVQAQARKPASRLRDTIGGVAGNFLEGVLPGSSGFVRGVREMAINAAKAPFSDAVDFEPMKSYEAGRDFQENRNKISSLNAPTSTNIAQGTGLVAGLALPAAKIAKGANMAQKAWAGIKTGGAYGAASGAMSSDQDNITGKAEDAVSAGLIGAGVGGVLPVATRIASAAAAPLRPLTQRATRMFGYGLEGLGSFIPGHVGNLVRKEGQQLTRDPARATANRQLDQDIREAVHPQTRAPMRPRQVPGEVERRQELGVPAVPADLDEGLRRSFGRAARSPGPATMRVRQLVDERKQRETARTVEHLGETLGPIGNVEQQADLLNREARAAARPLYDQAYAQPIPVTQDLQELFSRPTGRTAMDHATRAMRDNGRSPAIEGRIQNADGTWREGSVPTMETYDRAKTALDDLVFAGQSPFAAPEVTRDSRGANDIRRRLLAIMDGEVPEGLPAGPGLIDAPGGLNPHWKPARDAFGGPTQNRKALELGQDMAKADAEEAASRLNGMTADQVDHFRLGHRSGMAADVRSVPDYGDAARRVAGSLKKRDAVEAIHGPEATEALLQRLGIEQDAAQTWKAIRGVTGNGAPRIDLQDQQIEDAAQGIIQTLSGRPGAGLLNIAGAMAQGNRMAPEVNGHVASVLAEQDPVALSKAMREVGRERARKTLVDRNAAQATQRLGRVFGDLLGTNIIEQVPEEDYTY